MTDRYAVFGNPIKHSRSPQIHSAFAAETGQEISYTREQVEPGEFAAAAKHFFETGGKGLNITVPFKEDAFAYADQLSERAHRAGAVNTLARQANGEILGDNTDGAGLMRDICINLAWAITGKRVLLLGAGGAIMGVLEPLLKRQPDFVIIANRTENKAIRLADQFTDLGNISGMGFSKLIECSHFDLIINGTSASLSGELPPLPNNILTENTQGYDMMYAAKPTAFMAWMIAQGATQVADGLGMLVEQAAEAFTLWRGVRPETQAVIRSIRESMTTEST